MGSGKKGGTAQQRATRVSMTMQTAKKILRNRQQQRHHRRQERQQQSHYRVV
jgi:hypothetical protein